MARNRNKQAEAELENQTAESENENTESDGSGDGDNESDEGSSELVTELKWNDYSLPLSDIVPPECLAQIQKIVGLAQRGFTHEMGNVIASKVVGWKEAKNDDGTLKYGDAELVTLAHDARVAKIAAIKAGKLGVRIGGPRMVGIDKIMRDIALEELEGIAARRKSVLPKKAADLNPLVASRLAAHQDRIRQEAQGRMDKLSAMAADDADSIALAALAAA